MPKGFQCGHYLDLRCPKCGAQLYWEARNARTVCPECDRPKDGEGE